jgi:purine-nucleoside phosphorylase
MNDFIFTAQDLIEHLGSTGKLKLPKNALMCLSPSFAAQLAKGQPWRIERALGAKWAFVSEHLVLVSGFGIGAPAIAAKFEEMKSLGVGRVVFVGTAGALQEEMSIGDVVLVERAKSAEGTSKHYSKKEEFQSDETLLQEITESLRAKDLEFRRGSTWTTDAPYREQRATLKRLQNQGVMCVDMEASALYAVAESIGLKTVGVFLISDKLNDGVWQPGFGHSALREKFATVAQQLLQVMSRWNA